MACYFVLFRLNLEIVIGAKLFSIFLKAQLFRAHDLFTKKFFCNNFRRTNATLANRPKRTPNTSDASSAKSLLRCCSPPCRSRPASSSARCPTCRQSEHSPSTPAWPCSSTSSCRSPASSRSLRLTWLARKITGKRKS